MKLQFINEGIFESNKSQVEKEKSCSFIFFSNKFSVFSKINGIQIHTIYKIILFFELNFYVVQKYPY